MVSRYLQGKFGTVVVVMLYVVVVALLVGFGSGCQSDLIGPSLSCKLLYKGENNNQEHLSRGSGMNSRTGWTAGNPECTQP